MMVYRGAAQIKAFVECKKQFLSSVSDELALLFKMFDQTVEHAKEYLTLKGESGVTWHCHKRGASALPYRWIEDFLAAREIVKDLIQHSTHPSKEEISTATLQLARADELMVELLGGFAENEGKPRGANDRT